MIKISVIIPTYKPGGYIEKSIRSVADQSLGRGWYELVVVLNGCGEPYLSQLKTLLATLPPELNTRLIHTEQPGVCHARNIGIEAAQGQYLCFLDDDDWLSPVYLDRLYTDAAPDRLTCSNAIAFLDGSGVPQRYYLSAAYAACAGQNPDSLFSGRKFLSAAWGKLIPKAVIGPTRFDERFVLGEDSLFMFAISRRVRAICLSPADAVYFVRMRAQSASRSRYAYGYRANVLLRLVGAYTRQWLTAPWTYSFPLYLSRVAATLRKLFMNHYE